MFALPSDIYSRGSGLGYGYHQRPNPRAASCRGSYHNPFADVRALESEILAQEAARREEEALERRLQELRRSRLSPPYSHDVGPYSSRHYDNWLHQPSDNLLETLRLEAAEQEQIAKLEALRKRRRELEAEEKLKAAAELRIRKEAQELARREQAKRLRELAIAEEEEKLGQLIQRQNLAKATNDVRYPQPKSRRQSGYPRSQSNLRQTSRDVLDFILELAATEKNAPKIANTARSQQRSTPETIDFASFLQQLGLLASPSEAQPNTKQTEKQTVQQPMEPSASQFNPTVELPKPSKVTVTTPIETTLRDELEKRLGGEQSNEVRDTILAIMNSLSDVDATAGFHSSAQPSHFSAASSNKGKGKAVPTTEPVLPSLNEVKVITSRLREIESRFYTLENEFEFPGKLDFTASSTPTAPLSPTLTPGPITSHLAFTATNQPVRYYEQALSGLLAQLDSIESYGNEELRNKRKEVVRKVENALEDLEQRVEARWKSSLKETKRRSVTIEDVTTPEEHLMIPENVPPSPVLQATQSIPAHEPELKSSSQSHEAEASASVVEELTQSPVEPAETTVSISGEAVAEVVESSHPISEDTVSTYGQVDNTTIVAVSGPVEEAIPDVLESLFEANLSAASQVDLSAVERSRESETSVKHESLVDSRADNLDTIIHEFPPEQPVALSFQDEELIITSSKLDASDPHPDLSATIRPSTDPVALKDRPTSPATSELSMESDMSVTETEGLLLENGVVEATHDMSDSESTVSDWSEVDPVTSH